MKKYYIQDGVTKVTPRTTNHQKIMIIRMDDTENEDSMRISWPARPKSWINDKGNKVWSFETNIRGKLKGDPWDGQTGESLLRKGIIEPSFTIRHDGDYERYPVGREIQFYRLTELGRQIASS